MQAVIWSRLKRANEFSTASKSDKSLCSWQKVSNLDEKDVRFKGYDEESWISMKRFKLKVSYTSVNSWALNLEIYEKFLIFKCMIKIFLQMDGIFADLNSLHFAKFQSTIDLDILYAQFNVIHFNNPWKNRVCRPICNKLVL